MPTKNIFDIENEDVVSDTFETGRGKSGEKFYVIKFHVLTPSGRSRPLVLRKNSVSTFSLKKVTKEGRLSHYYFSIVFGSSPGNEA